jgi:EmrB/QacA subfamily drug resistance transporter
MQDLAAAAPAPAVSEADKFRIIIGVLIAMLLGALDQTIVAPAIPAMGQALGGSNYISWIVSAYFLTATAVTPLYGKLADIHGRRLTLFAAIGVFVVGSILCALAPSMWALIFGRAVQGLGGGGLIALAQTVIADLLPPRERAKYAVYISAVWAVASIAGPILGGLITEHLSWPVIFWLNLPLAALAVLMTNETLKKLPYARRDHKLDFLGAGLVVLATVALLLALALGPQPQWGWTSPAVLGLFGGAAVLAAVIARHLLSTPQPLIPLEVLGNRVVLAGTFSVFFAMAAFIGLIVYIPLFLQQVLGMSTSASGAALVGYMLGTVLGASIAGQTMARIKHYKRLPLAGLALGCLGLAWIAWRAASLTFWECEAVLILVGFGSGFQFPVTTVAVQNAVDPRDIGVVTGVLAFLRALGSSIGIAAVGAVGAASGIAVGLGESAGSVVAPVAQHTSGTAFTPVFAAASLSLALGFAMLALMPELVLRGRAPAGAAAAKA